MAQSTGSTRAQRARAANQARRRKEARQKQLMIGGVAIAVVAIVVGVMVAVSMGGGGKQKAKGNTGSVSSAQLAAVTSAPISGVPDNVQSQITPLKPVSGKPALTRNGKPEFLYIGAEFCPYCAAERWAIVGALSRFGTFTGLGVSHSSPTDTDPNTPTFTFRNAKYTSPYIDAKLIENEDENHNQIQPVSKDEQNLWQSLQGELGYPFIDIGNKYWTSVQFDPGILKGKTFDQIAQSMKQPTTSPGSVIDATANSLTAAICEVTGDKPANVCTAAPIQALKKKLGG